MTLTEVFLKKDGFVDLFYGIDLQSSRKRRSEMTCFAGPVMFNNTEGWDNTPEQRKSLEKELNKTVAVRNGAFKKSLLTRTAIFQIKCIIIFKINHSSGCRC